MAFNDVVDLVEHAVSRGVNLFDTGSYNSGLHDEVLDADIVLGRALRESSLHREDYLLAQKLWTWNIHREPLIDSFTADIKRVGLERADVLVFGHYKQTFEDDFGLMVEKAVRGAAEIIEACLADTWGACDWPVDVMRRAWRIATDGGLPRPQFEHLKYSLARRVIAEGEPFEALFAESGIALQPSFVFEGGLLAGSTSSRPTHLAIPWPMPRTVTETHIVPGIHDYQPRLSEVADRLGLAVAQFSLAFTLTNPHTTNVLIGSTGRDQLDQNIEAVRFAEEHGDAIRVAAEEFCMDVGLVNPHSEP